MRMACSFTLTVSPFSASAMVATGIGLSQPWQPGDFVGVLQSNDPAGFGQLFVADAAMFQNDVSLLHSQPRVAAMSRDLAMCEPRRVGRLASHSANLFKRLRAADGSP